MIKASVAAYCTYMCFFETGNKISAFQQSIICCSFFALYFLFLRSQYSKYKVKLLLPASFVVGGISSTGKVLFSGLKFSGYSARGLLIIDALGYAMTIYCLGLLLYGGIENANKAVKGKTWLTIFDAKPLLRVSAMLLLLWLPHLLLKYPSGINIDSLDAIDFSLGIQEKNYNPIAYVAVLGTFFRFGMWLGEPNMGLFLFNVGIFLLLAFAVAEGYALLADIKATGWSKTIYLLFFSFSPFVTGYIGNCIKDMPYISFMLIFLVQIGRWMLFPEMFWKNKRQIAVAGIAGYGMAIFRNNGLYILIIMLVLMLVVELRRNGNKKIIKMMCLLLAAILPLLTNSTVKKLMDDNGNYSIRENFSLPFQQTARLILEHPELISDEEKAVIDKVLDYDEAAIKYNPIISDPVKSLYREECTAKDRAEYISLWFKQFFRAPVTYLEAVAAQNYFLFYPEASNYYYYYSCPFYDFTRGEKSIAHIGSPSYLSDVLGWYYQYFFVMLHELPVLYTINNMSSYNILLLILLCFAITKKDRVILLMIPALVTLFGIPLGPCIWGHPRYVFPVIYSMPLLLGVYSRNKS